MAIRMIHTDDSMRLNKHHAKTIAKVTIPFLIFLYAVMIGCPIYRLFGTACPGCGMTRAFFFAMRLDFQAAFQYHPLFGVFMVETVYVLFRGHLLKRCTLTPKMELIIGIISLSLLWIVWIYRRFVIHTI